MMAYVSNKARTKSILIYNPNDHNVSKQFSLAIGIARPLWHKMTFINQKWWYLNNTR